MKFCAIAEYLNTSVVRLRKLAKRGELPGSPDGADWRTTTHELDRWYRGLSGQQWADRFAGGRVGHLEVKVRLPVRVAAASLERVLMGWERSGEVRVISGLGTRKATFVVQFKETASDVRHGLVAARPDKSPVGVPRDIRMVHDCLSILGTHPVRASLSPKRLLGLRFVDDMPSLPQVRREIVVQLLSWHAGRLASEIEGISHQDAAGPARSSPR